MNYIKYLFLVLALSSTFSLFSFLPAYAASKGGAPYVGIASGYSWGKDTVDLPRTKIGKFKFKEHNKGASMGVFAGYGYRFNNDFYLAGEVDYTRNLNKKLLKHNAGSTVGVSVLPGYFVAPKTLLFTRVGYRRDSLSANGMTLGAGIAQKLTDRIQVRLEYVYNRFENPTTLSKGKKPSIGKGKLYQHDQGVRLGVAYGF